MGNGARRAETLTVLFTDLVDSTALRSRLGEEPFDRVRHDHDAVVTGAIESGGGRVIKSTGDGVMATFTGAADAVGAAVAVQQAIYAYNARDTQVRLSVRIGLSVGDVTIEADGDCFGLPVVEAQRLEAAAQPDQILCSSLVRELARGRGDHRFTPMGLLELKGLNDAVATDEVLWEPLVAAEAQAPTLPPLLQATNTFDFAGRTRELAVLTDAWKASCEGPGHLVLLAGEPGIGKTRLVTELARKVLDQGGLVLAGRCDEDLNAPYGPVAGALTAWAATAGPGADLGEWPGELVRIAPELTGLLGLVADEDGGGADPALLIRAVRSWLAATAAVAPTLLVLDDLHWADAATLLVVRSLFDRSPLERLIVVGTYRDTDLDRRHPLAATLADLRRHDHVTRVSVEGLDEDGVVEFLARAASFELDQDKAAGLARAVWAESAGNPFFVGEILRHLAETGAIVERDGVWTSDLDPSEVGIPEGIREVVGRRLSRLVGTTEEVLSAAAVIGLEFEVGLLVRVLGSDEDDVLDALEGAAQAALVQEVTAGRWRFAHGIVRETLLDELSSSRRVRQHRKVAHALEELHAADLDAVVNQLAYHWGEAAAGGVDLDKAFAWGIRAGDLALAKPAVEDAVRWYEHALGLLDPDDPAPALQCAGLIKLARAQALLGETDHARAVIQAATLAQQLGDHEQLTAALVITGRSGYTQDEAQADGELIAHLEGALDVVGADEPGLRAQLLSALALELQFVGEADRRAVLITQALDLARESGQVEALLASEIASFFSLPWGRQTRPYMEERLAAVLELKERLLADGDGYRVASLVAMIWWYGLCIDRREEVLLAEGLERDLVERHPTPLLERTVASRTVMRDLIGGDLDAANDHLRHLEELAGTDGGTQVLRYCWALEAGLAEAAIPILEHVVTTTAQPKMAEAMLAYALAEVGEVDRATAMLDDAVAAGLASLPEDTLVRVTIGMWLEVCLRTRRADLVEAMTPWVDALGDVAVLTGVMYLGSPERYRSGFAHLRGDDAAAIEHYRAAAAAHEATGAIPLLAATKLEWASMLVDSGDLDGAATLVRAALDDIGARRLTRRRQQADALLAQIGG